MTGVLRIRGVWCIRVTANFCRARNLYFHILLQQTQDMNVTILTSLKIKIVCSLQQSVWLTTHHYKLKQGTNQVSLAQLKQS